MYLLSHTKIILLCSRVDRLYTDLVRLHEYQELYVTVLITSLINSSLLSRTQLQPPFEYQVHKINERKVRICLEHITIVILQVS